MLDPSKNPHFSNRITESYTLYNNGGYGFQPQTKTQQNYWNDMGELLAEKKLIDDEDSGVCSPPLWRTSPPRSPQHRPNHYRSLSPSSRAQAIAIGQKELMEMVSRMPEGCYELSLKDIVEQNIVDQEKEKEKQEKLNRERNSEENKIRGSEKDEKKNDKKVQINRSSSIDNNRDGFLLKMVFPISLGSKKKKKKSNSVVRNNSGKDGRVSPRPLLLDGSAKSIVENEWWKNRYAETGDTESTGLSSNSGSSKCSGSSSSRSSSRNASAGNWRGGGCWSCFFRKREHKEE